MTTEVTVFCLLILFFILFLAVFNLSPNVLDMKVLRVSLPAALECITISPMQDLCFAGASNGSIYVIDLSVTAIALSAAKASVGYVSMKQGGNLK